MVVEACQGPWQVGGVTILPPQLRVDLEHSGTVERHMHERVYGGVGVQVGQEALHCHLVPSEGRQSVTGHIRLAEPQHLHVLEGLGTRLRWKEVRFPEDGWVALGRDHHSGFLECHALHDVSIDGCPLDGQGKVTVPIQEEEAPLATPFCHPAGHCRADGGIWVVDE